MPIKSAVAKRPRGRPAHVPTAALRRKVSIAAGGGMLHEQIAVAIGINRDTLSKYYSLELSEGALARRLEVIAALHKAATSKGSSSAAKAYLEHAAEIAAPPAPAGADAPAAETAPIADPEKKLGKKEQAKADALTAAQGTGWADLLPGHATPQ